MPNETVRPMTEGQRNDLAKTAFEAVPEMNFTDADAVLANKSPLVAEIRSVFEKYAPSSLANHKLGRWQKIYRDHFGVELGPVVIPIHRKGFDRLLVVAQEVTAQQVFDVCEKLFPCWKSTSESLDVAVPTNDRTSSAGAYACWVRDRIEADEELKNLSANNLTAQEKATETLLERELHELVYFFETDKHLDIKNVTLIAGSRSRDGGVPSAYWHGGEFFVNLVWYSPGHAFDGLRAREVVS